MIKKLLSAAVSLLLTAAILLSSPLSALSEEIGGAAEDILRFNIQKSGADDYEDWVNRELIPNAGAGAEWYVFTLKQSLCPLDGVAYIASLNEVIAQGRVLGASEALKFALALVACGDTESDFVQRALNEYIGAQGIMSLVYGLHLVNNGFVSEKYSRDELIDNLLRLRKSDGGWAVIGNYSDTDVTAMTLQALAPHKDKSEEINTAIDEALNFLSGKQTESGAFLGFGGGDNTESTAQALIALSALGIDIYSDERFIKNGHNCLDGLNSFRLKDGSFCHVIDGGYNSTATTQAFLAYVSLWRQEMGYGSLYRLSPAPERSILTSLAASGVKAAAKQTISYKPIAIAAAFALALIVSLVLWLKGKRHFKNYLFIAGGFIVVSLVILFTNFSSTQSYYSGEKAVKSDPIGSVTMSIRCDVIASYSSEYDYIPADGTILSDTVFVIEEGDTAFDILTEAAREYGLQLENRGSSVSMVYVKGIYYIYEYAFGEQSGWMYYVNGIAPSVNSGEYVLKDGDVIQWMYSRDIGADLKDYIIKPEQ